MINFLIVKFIFEISSPLFFTLLKRFIPGGFQQHDENFKSKNFKHWRFSKADGKDTPAFPYHKFFLYIFSKIFSHLFIQVIFPGRDLKNLNRSCFFESGTQR